MASPASPDRDGTGRADSPMTQPIPVLVVIVNYKSGKLTLNALESLRAEREDDGLDLHVVVVENASGDEALLREGIEARFSDFVSLAVSPRNGGFGAGNNHGLAHAHELGLRPRYVHFLNPDTEIRPGAVGTLVRFLEAHPKAGIAGSSFELGDGRPWRIGFRFPSSISEFEDSIRLGPISRILRDHVVPRELGHEPEPIDWPSGASMMCRREVLENVGGFDESFFLYFEEIDLCLRARKAGWTCWYVPDSRVMHICGQSSGVTTRDDAPKRLPDYWFESRRRYFVKHHGHVYAAIADAARLVGSSVAIAKDVVRGIPVTPFYVRDLFRHSVLRPQNHVPAEPERVYFLPR